MAHKYEFGSFGRNRGLSDLKNLPPELSEDGIWMPIVNI